MPVPVLHMNNSAWQSARARAADKWEEQTGTPAPEGFRKVRVHDLKHAFGRRLRAAGVSFLLGHKSARITTHYSGPELANLIAAAEKVCEDKKFPQKWVYGAGWGESGMSKILIPFVKSQN